MFERAVAIVEDPYAVPQLRLLRLSETSIERWRRLQGCARHPVFDQSMRTYLRIGQVVQRLLVGRVRLRQIILHQQTVACDSAHFSFGRWARTHGTPDLAVVLVNIENALKILNGLVELIPGSVDIRDGRETHDGIGVVSHGVVECCQCSVVVLHTFCNGAWAISIKRAALREHIAIGMKQTASEDL